MAALTAFWFFLVGTCLGSFLNVVVYRLPAGLSLWKEPSRCPACMTPVRQRDNIPIYGWLKLGGRCRSCGWRIPIRYMLVEMLVGLQFVVMLLAELTSGGANLPGRAPEPWAGVVWAVWYAKYPDLLEIYGYYLLVWYFATGATLMARDGHGIPWSWGLFAGIAGAVWPAIDPRVHPLVTASSYGFDLLTTFHRSVAVADCMAGAVLGATAAWLLSAAQGAGARGETPRCFAAVCGLFLGFWGSAVWILWWWAFWGASRLAAESVGRKLLAPLLVTGTIALHVQVLTARWSWELARASLPWFGWMPH